MKEGSCSINLKPWRPASRKWRRSSRIQPWWPDPRLRELSKLRAELEPVVLAFQTQRNLLKQLEEAESILGDKSMDADLREMAELEIPGLKKAIAEGDAEIKRLLIPKDPADAKNVIRGPRGNGR